MKINCRNIFTVLNAATFVVLTIYLVFLVGLYLLEIINLLSPSVKTSYPFGNPTLGWRWCSLETYIGIKKYEMLFYVQSIVFGSVLYFNDKKWWACAVLIAPVLAEFLIFTNG